MSGWASVQRRRIGWRGRKRRRIVEENSGGRFCSSPVTSQRHRVRERQGNMNAIAHAPIFYGWQDEPNTSAPSAPGTAATTALSRAIGSNGRRARRARRRARAVVDFLLLLDVPRRVLAQRAAGALEHLAPPSDRFASSSRANCAAMTPVSPPFFAPKVPMCCSSSCHP